MHFYIMHQSDETDSKNKNKKDRMRRKKMGWKEGKNYNQIKIKSNNDHVGFQYCVYLH